MLPYQTYLIPCETEEGSNEFILKRGVKAVRGTLNSNNEAIQMAAAKLITRLCKHGECCWMMITVSLDLTREYNRSTQSHYEGSWNHRVSYRSREDIE